MNKMQTHYARFTWMELDLSSNEEIFEYVRCFASSPNNQWKTNVIHHNQRIIGKINISMQRLDGSYLWTSWIRCEHDFSNATAIRFRRHYNGNRRSITLSFDCWQCSHTQVCFLCSSLNVFTREFLSFSTETRKSFLNKNVIRRRENTKRLGSIEQILGRTQLHWRVSETNALEFFHERNSKGERFEVRWSARPKIWFSLFFFVLLQRFVPSKADLSVFEAIGKAPAGNLTHVQRWYRHIASFTTQERNAWGGQALPQVAGGKPTVAAPAKAAGKHIDNTFHSRQCNWLELTL